jgi:hypothetical protein
MQITINDELLHQAQQLTGLVSETETIETIVQNFIENSLLKQSFKQSLQQAKNGEVHPIETLWDGIDD